VRHDALRIHVPRVVVLVTTRVQDAVKAVVDVFLETIAQIRALAMTALNLYSNPSVSAAAMMAVTVMATNSATFPLRCATLTPALE